MTDQEIIHWLWDNGYFWFPDFPDTFNVKQSDLPTLTLSDTPVVLAIVSAQKADANFDAFVWKHHGRGPIADGHIGPATREFVGRLTDPTDSFSRCPLPDRAPPPGIAFNYDDPEIQAAVESMQRAAAEREAAGIEGPYWRGCDPQRPDVHSLVIGIDASDAPSVFLQDIDKILEARRAIAAEIGVAVRFVVNPQSLTGLQQLQVYKFIAGGVIGMNYFPSSNSCGRIPNGSMDSSYNPSDWRMHANLGTHESEGHGFGFEHTRGGIMNPSILLVWPLTWKGDPAWSQVTRYYPATPLDPTPVPDPTPIPNQKIVIENSPGMTAAQRVRALQAFTAAKDEILGEFYYKSA